MLTTSTTKSLVNIIGNCEGKCGGVGTAFHVSYGCTTMYDLFPDPRFFFVLCSKILTVAKIKCAAECLLQ